MKNDRSDSERSDESDDGFYIPFSLNISFTNFQYNHKIIMIKFDEVYE